jgi:hypothetical protein
MAAVTISGYGMYGQSNRHMEVKDKIMNEI